MKAPTAVIAMLFISAVSLYSQRINNDWEVNQPRDTDAYIFSRGFSKPRDTEREAILEAESMSENELARKIYMLADSRFINIIIQQNGIIREEAIELNYITTKLVIPNSSRLFKTKQQENGILAYCLIYISRKDAAKAELSAKNDLTALYAYNYFSQRVPGLKPLTTMNSFKGVDYHSWILSHCGVLSISGNTQEHYLNLLDALVRELVPGVISFAARNDGRPSRFIYGAEKLDIISRVLQKHGIDFLYGGTPLMLTVSGSQKLGDLMNLDPSTVYVAGVERVHQNHAQTQNAQILGREIVRRVQTGTHKRLWLYTLPQTFNNELEILEHLRKNPPACRYLVAYAVETIIELEREIGIPAYLFATGKITVYDQWSGDITYSVPIKNGIPIGENDLGTYYELLTKRLINTASLEAIVNAIGGN